MASSPSSSSSSSSSRPVLLLSPTGTPGCTIPDKSRDTQDAGQSLRRLLPAPEGIQKNTVPLGAKMSRVSAACEACRTRKTRCNGHRPKCNECIKRVTICQYTETNLRQIRRRYDHLKERRNTYEELIEFLKTMSERDSINVLRRVRAGDSVSAILRQLREGDLLMGLSVMPELEMHYEFPYLAKMPAHLQTSDNPTLRSVLYEAIQASEQTTPERKASLARYGSHHLKPLHSAEIIDPLLSEAFPSRWTTVSSDDRLLRKLLEAFFIHEYWWMSIFHKDFMLEDMISGQTRFCSSLLVNAILAKGCTTYQALPSRSMFWDPQNLGYQFLAEARRLWDLEADTASLTTIQAGCIITVVYNANALDKIGLSYTLQALSMSHQIGLFRVCPTDDPKLEHAKVFTAWGLFSWQVILTFYYFRPPYLSSPPSVPLPDPDQNPKWYPEIWLRYPRDKNRYAMLLGPCLKATSGLHLILHDLTATTFSSSEKPKRLQWDQVSHFQARLYAWFDALPVSLSTRCLVFPLQLKIHCEFHSSIIILCESQLATADCLSNPLTAPQKHAVEAVAAHAKVQLETLMRVYYLRHSFKSPDICIVFSLLQLGNMAAAQLALAERNAISISSEMTGELRSTLVLILRGLFDQAQNFYMSSVALDLMKKSLTEGDLNLSGRFVPLKDHPLVQDAIQHAPSNSAQWVYPIITLHDNPEVARVERLAKRFEKLSSNDTR